MQDYGFQLRHFPTWFLIIGYPLYWVELYWLNQGDGQTSPLAWIAVCIALLPQLYLPRKEISQGIKSGLSSYGALSVGERIFIFAAGALSISILGTAFYASTFPVHLIQEFDALNYHITLPRQHLLWGTFAHIPWSSGDLFLLPIDFALAPFWLATPLPNKIPQFFFIPALVIIVYGFVKHAMGEGNRFQSAFLAAMAVISFHGLGIQFGTAMLDIVLCYLFFAFLDSLCNGNYFLAAVEFAFFFWAKAFIPFQFILILIVTAVIIMVMSKLGIRSDWKKFTEQVNMKFFGLFLILSLFVAGPFFVKSFYYTGTPVYPFFTKPAAAFNPTLNEAEPYKGLLHEAALVHLQSKNHYGHGRSLGDFIKHLWLLGVPEKGLNNAFDYPLGLTFLLFLGPFIYWLGNDLKNKKISIIYIFIILYWMTWWFGSQQARFLYIPIVLMVVAVMSKPQPITKIFQFAVLLALFLNCVSVLRAHQKSFLVETPTGYLREKDKKLLEMAQIYDKNGRKGFIVTDFWDAAYAQFPIMVSQKMLPWSVGAKER